MAAFREFAPMIAAKAKEPGKAKAEAPGQKASQKPAPPKEAAFNPLWERLALGVQAKLAVSAPDDPYEREADRVAEQVMRMPDRPSGNHPLSFSSVHADKAQRQCAACEEEQDDKLQRKESGSAAETPATVPPVVHEMLSTTGQPLDSASRSFFVPRFGYDFSQVRIHDDSEAHRSAAALDAQAFTIGRHIAFSSDRYAPDTVEGRRLLAHELVHVVQQSHPAAAGPQSNSFVTGPGHGVERDADALAAGAEPTSALSVEKRSSAAIHLQPKPKPKAPTESKTPVTVDNVDELYGPLTEDIAKQVFTAYGSPLVGHEKELISAFKDQGFSAWLGLAIIKQESSFANRDNNPTIDERNVANPFSVHFNTNLKRWPKGCGKNLLLIEDTGKEYTPGETVKKECAAKGFRLSTFAESAQASAKTMAKLGKTKEGIDAYREEGGYKKDLNGQLNNILNKIKLKPK